MAKATTKTEDLRQKSDDQLSEELTALKREAYNLRFQAATNQLEAPARVREVRRTIAKIKTLQAERSKTAAAAKA
jgi:large subunit ribosomal protein L29